MIHALPLPCTNRQFSDGKRCGLLGSVIAFFMDYSHFITFTCCSQWFFAGISDLSHFRFSPGRPMESFTVTVTALCSYAMSKNYLKFRPLYVVLFTIPSFFNGGMVPVYLNIRNLGLLDTFWVYILPAGFSFFYMVLMISAFRAIPESLEEAAFIDGAGFFSVFIKIILPVSVPTLATVALYAAVGQWNAWYDTMFYTNKNSLQTLSSVLMRIVRENNLGEMTSELTSDMENRSYNPEGVKMATMVVSVLPIIFIYPFLQRYFVKGIMVGSIKG